MRRRRCRGHRLDPDVIPIARDAVQLRIGVQAEHSHRARRRAADDCKCSMPVAISSLSMPSLTAQFQYTFSLGGDDGLSAQAHAKWRRCTCRTITSSLQPSLPASPCERRDHTPLWRRRSRRCEQAEVDPYCRREACKDLDFGARANSQFWPVCIGSPGSLVQAIGTCRR